MKRLLCAVALTAACGNVLATAVPFTPEIDAQIVEHLPGGASAERQQLRQMRTQLQQQPDALPLALDIAQRNVALARRYADPRYLGYAEAALGHWLQQATPPAEVLVLQAILLQAKHQFTAAEAQLQRAAKQQRNNPQIWLTLASIQQVRGDYVAARQSCQRLLLSYDAGVAGDCLASVDAVNGRAREAQQYWSQRLRSGQAPQWEQQWLTLQLAESGQRLGDVQQAQRWFAQAVSTSSDSYDKAAYADFLLEQGKSAEVIQLLGDDTRADPLLLRLAQALQQSGDARAAAYIQQLAARFDATRQRGDLSHLREEARFQLLLLKQPQRALQLAEQNWQQQKEPADALILLQSAIAAKQPARAAALKQWLLQQRLQDVRLDALLRQV